MKGNWPILRQVIHRRFSTLRSSIPSSRSFALSSPVLSLISAPNSLFTASTIHASKEFNFYNTSLLRRRSLCSEAGGPNGVVILKSDEEFDNAMNKAQDGSLPSIFYFTAAWCGPCRFIFLVITELSEQYPDVTTYKVDIDERAARISSSLKLQIATALVLQIVTSGTSETHYDDGSRS